MSPELWRRVNEVLPLALERPPEERPAFLEVACGGDAALRQEVESLLAVETAQAGRFERPPFAEPSLTGARLGPYLLEEEIGRGGMGTVHAARRVDDAYRHRVAVKVLKRGMDSDEIVRRFRDERRILASLDHPHVARFLDGGTTPDHRPFFVLELVEGCPIDRWCAEQGLTVEARLLLFLEVCGAVQAAHRSLVVHRDLKPGNILVTGRGEPKLLDFGIAKLLEPGEGAATAPDLRPMTPAYASPEQWRGEPVTTGSDVYSLGVLLHELLTGRKPEAGSGNEPRRPSLAAGPALQRRLRGDLDSILLKALETDPRRRYGSAEDLAEDLRRYLDGRPVGARQATLLYRAGRFVRRRRSLLAAAVLLLAAAGAGAADRLAQHRQTARERDRAERISSFMIDLFRTTDTREGGGAALSAREILARGARRAEVDLAGEPELQADLLQTLGEMHRRLGLYAPARPLLLEALDRRRALCGPADPRVAETLAEIGQLEQDQGRFAAAEARYREAIAIHRAAGHPDLSQSLVNLATLRRDEGKLPEAEALYREALAHLRTWEPPNERYLATCTNGLALVLMDQGRLEAAEPLFRDALARFRSVRAGPSLEAAQVLNNLAGVWQARGDQPAAEVLWREALTVRRQLLEPGHPEIGESANNLALLLIYRGRLEEAEPLAREALQIARTTLGKDHPRVALTLNNLAYLLGEQERFDEAEALFREALAISRAALGPGHPEVAKQLHNLAGLLRRRQRTAAAEPLERQAVELAAGALGAHHPETAYYRLGLAQLRLQKGEAQTAERISREALDDLRHGLPAGHWRLALGESVLGECLRVEGRVAEAEPLLRRGAAALAAARGEHASLTREARARLARLPSAAR